MRRPTTRRISSLALLAFAAALLGGSGVAAPNAVYPGGAITFADCCNNTNATTGPPSKAAPYPSTVTVPTSVSGTITEVKVTVTLDHTWPDDVDLLLASPGGVGVLLMSDAGGSSGNAITPDTLTFSDFGTGTIPDTPQLVDGTYRPSDYGSDCDNATEGDTFPSPAPPPPYFGTLAAFKGVVAAGEWRLFAVDDCNLGNTLVASISSWSLHVTAAGPTAVTLKAFTAVAKKRAVELRWRTAAETSALGFNVYRFTGKQRVKVNRALIRAKRSGTARGAAYRLIDASARARTSVYRLQVVTLAGKRSWVATSVVRRAR